MSNKILMLFIDGVGIGENNPTKNPFFKYGFSGIEKHFGSLPHLGNSFLTAPGGYIFPLDAVQGVPGIPQSGTGQTSIFCGVNAQKILGEHFGPYPYSTLLPIIEERNIFSVLKRKNRSVYFANAYPRAYFKYIKGRRTRQSVTTIACGYAGLPLHTGTDVRKKLALTAEITGERWNKNLGYKLPLLTGTEAANRLLTLSTRHHFTLYEFFLTDYLGHGRLVGYEEKIHRVLEEFFATLLNNLPQEVTLLVCSDHGNYEDVSLKSHTINPAFGLSFGTGADYFKSRLNNLSDIHPAVIEFIG